MQRVIPKCTGLNAVIVILYLIFSLGWKLGKELVWAVLALTISHVLMAGAVPEWGVRGRGRAGQNGKKGWNSLRLARQPSLSQFLYVVIGPLHVGEFDLSHT